MIDALEGRDVATADVPGAYLHADMDDLVIMRLTGLNRGHHVRGKRYLS